MSKQREALKMALDTLRGWIGIDEWIWPVTAKETCKKNSLEAITAIREALAEPEPEPTTDGELYAAFLMGLQSKKPPTRKPLTDEEIDAEFDRECWVTVVFADGARGIALDKVTARDFARSIELAHGIGVKHE